MLVGRAGIVMEAEPTCFYPDLLVRLRFDEEQICPLVATLTWNSVSVHSELVRRTKTTNGIYKLGFDDIREHRMPLPSRAQQSAIRDASRSWRLAANALAERLAHARGVKKATLSAAMGNA